MTTPIQDMLKNVLMHTHCVERTEKGDSVVSKFVFEHRFCDNVKLGEDSKEEDVTSTYMPTFILNLPDKEDCSSANVHLVSNIGHFVINTLEMHIDKGCLICLLRDQVPGMTISEFIDIELSVKDGSVH